MNMKRFAALILALAMCLLCACSSDKDDRIAELEAQVAEKDETIASLEAQVADYEAAGIDTDTVASLEADIAAKDETIASLEADIAAKDETIASLEHDIAAKDYVAEFDGGYVTVAEAMGQYEYVEYMYSMYGYSMDGYEDYIKQDIATSLANEKIIAYKGTELGLDVLTEEEEAELTASVEANYQMYIDTYRSNFVVEGLTDEEIDANTAAYLAENGVTVEELYKQEKSHLVSDKVYAYVVESVEVTEDEVYATYEQYVAEDMTNYGDPYYYESAVMSGYTLYWHPAGYRNVRQVLVAFDDDQSARYDDITDTIYDLEAELAEAQAAEEAAAEEAAAEETTEEDTEDTSEEVTEETVELRSVEEIQADLDAANAELDALFAELEPTANDVINAFNGGASIHELIALYGGDPGSINADGTTNTYVVSADSLSYDPAFIEAAMSVEEIGGLSEPTRGMYGLYIVYYDSDVADGPVDFETVKDDLTAETLDTRRAEAYDAQVATWATELNLVFYYENFR